MPTDIVYKRQPVCMAIVLLSSHGVQTTQQTQNTSHACPEGTSESRSSWWRHQMEAFSALLTLCARNSPVTGEFPAQRPVARSFDIIFDLRLSKCLSKQSWSWWFETPSCSLWRHCNVTFTAADQHCSSVSVISCNVHKSETYMSLYYHECTCALQLRDNFQYALEATSGLGLFSKILLTPAYIYIAGNYGR